MIWIGLDDTDSLDSPGTGHLARELVDWLDRRFPIFGVTRHQLLQDPRVPMTAKNSTAVIHLQITGRVDMEGLAEEMARRIRERSAAGSDPGLCLARDVPAPVTAFGRRAKERLVTAGEARALADQARITLQSLGGDGSGVIGALAGVGLAASGNDGRFTLCGRLREMEGLQPVSVLLEAGLTRVQSLDEEPVTEGLIDTQGKLRPSLVEGKPVLWVERRDGHWTAIRKT